MKFIVIIVLSLLFSAKQSDAYSKLKQFVKETKSMELDFVEVKSSKILKEPIKKTGKLYFSGENIKWITNSPEKSILIITKEKSQIKIGTEAPKSIKNFDAVKHLMKGLVKGDAFDSPNFNTTFKRKGNTFIVTAIPNQARMKKYISKIELIFNSSTDLMTNMHMFQTNGGTINYTFSNHKRNQKMSDQTFKF